MKNKSVYKQKAHKIRPKRRRKKNHGRRNQYMVIPWTMALLQSMANLMERGKRHINHRRRKKKQLSIQRGTRNEEKTKWKLCSVHTLFLGICELNFVSISLDIRNGFVLVDCSVWVENAHEMKPLNMKNKTFTKQDQVGLAKHTGSDRKKNLFFFSYKNSKDHLNCQQACWKEEIWIKIAMKRWNQIFNLRKD